MHIFTGHTGAAHVTAEHFRMLMVSIFGNGSYILPVGNKLKHKLESNNQLTIYKGMMVHHGNLSGVNSESGEQVTLANGVQGMKRIDLVVNRYSLDESTGIESNQWVHIPGAPDATSPVAPSFIKGDVMNGDTIDDCPVFEIELDGLNIVSITPLLSEHPGIQRQITSGTEEPTGGIDGDVYIQSEE
ncbi:MAG: hypothetical protein U0L05_01450 [Schaedlerella sp.]|nr:hypothetical protein [Schaedlerella sp.]